MNDINSITLYPLTLHVYKLCKHKKLTHLGSQRKGLILKKLIGDITQSHTTNLHIFRCDINGCINYIIEDLKVTNYIPTSTISRKFTVTAIPAPKPEFIIE